MHVTDTDGVYSEEHWTSPPLQIVALKVYKRRYNLLPIVYSTCTLECQLFRTATVYAVNEGRLVSPHLAKGNFGAQVSGSLFSTP